MDAKKIIEDAMDVRNQLKGGMMKCTFQTMLNLIKIDMKNAPMKGH